MQAELLIGQMPAEYKFADMQASLGYIGNNQGKSFEPVKAGVAEIRKLADFIRQFDGTREREWLGYIPDAKEASTHLNVLINLFHDVLYVNTKGMFSLNANTFTANPDLNGALVKKQLLKNNILAKQILVNFDKSVIGKIKDIFKSIEETALVKKFEGVSLKEEEVHLSTLIFENISERKWDSKKIEALQKEIAEYRDLLERIEVSYQTHAFGIHFVN